MHQPDLPDHGEHASTAECGPLLAYVNLLAGFDSHILNQLGQAFTKVTVPDAAIICRQGKQADAFYVVAGGAFGA